MRSIVAPEKGKVTMVDLPIPEIGAYEALVRVEACSICNSTDTKLADGDFIPGLYPTALGHESVGRVVSVGERVRGFRVGDKVLRPVLYDRHVPGGRSTWGGMSEYAVVGDLKAASEDQPGVRMPGFSPSQQIVPDWVSPVHAAAMITLKETLQFAKAFGIGGGKPIAIVGTGPVAQAYCFYSKLMGASPIAVFGRRPAYRERFSTLGADVYVVGDDYPPSVRGQLARGGFGRAIEAVGDRGALKRCLDVVGASGQVRVYGIAPVSHSWDSADLRDPRVQHLGAREDEVHDEFLHMMASGRIKMDDWVSIVLPSVEYARAFDLVRSKQAAKVVLTFT